MQCSQNWQRTELFFTASLLLLRDYGYSKTRGYEGGLGAILGGIIAPLINKFLIGLFGNSFATVINNALGGGGFCKTFTFELSGWLIPTFSINKVIDLGEIIGGAFGGGFGPGSSAVTSNHYSLGYAN